MTRSCFAAIVRDPTVLKKVDANFNKEMFEFLQMDPRIEDSDRKEVMSKIRDFYFGPGVSVDSFDKLGNYTDMMTGILYSTHSTVELDLVSNHIILFGGEIY